MSDILKLQVLSIIRETDDCKTFTFINTNNEIIKYEAGQFLTFIFENNSGETRRSYSISSSPDIDNNIQITVKRVMNGEISRLFTDKINVGNILNCLPPAGRFILPVDKNKKRDIFLIAGGSGISPIFSHMKNILNNEPLSFITLIYANKNEGSTIFHKQLAHFESEHRGQLKIINVYSNPPENWHIAPRRLNNFLFQALVEENLKFNTSEAQFLVCGPPGLIRMAVITLHFMGFTKDQIKKENFVIYPVKAPGNLHLKSREIKIYFNNEMHKLVVLPDKFILQAALDNGINLPYSCKGGRCSSCTARIISGEVTMAINDVLTDTDLDNHLILTCTAQPVSDDVIIEI